MSALRQAKYRQRRDAGLVTISFEVDPQLLAMALNRVGIHVIQDREDLARKSATRTSISDQNNVVADSVTQ
jgi:hypothetical protein